MDVQIEETVNGFIVTETPRGTQLSDKYVYETLGEVCGHLYRLHMDDIMGPNDCKIKGFVDGLVSAKETEASHE